MVIPFKGALLLVGGCNCLLRELVASRKLSRKRSKASAQLTSLPTYINNTQLFYFVKMLANKRAEMM